MRLVKPAWLEHRDENRQFEIYSVAVSPDGSRLATGGLDGKVRLWSTKAIAAGPDYTGPKQLCSMSTHTGAVTVVRFSPNGRYLASGSDDRIALIWELDATRAPRQEFGQQGEKDTEAWTARKRLIGHDNDIQDLAWSPDSSLLVTVGLDSAIIVWSGTTFEKLKRIDSHQSHVKGISFDPANKYFVTCGDDRTARIIRYARTSPTELTFSVEYVVEAPFKNSPISTYFRRCSWSPNGEHIACSNATNGPVSTVSIINRGDWDSDISLVGHEGATEVAQFSPRLYVAKEGDDVKDAMSVVASSGQDRTLAIWNTANPRPLVVVHNASLKAVSDLAWSPDGLTLYASSLDGSVMAAIFDGGDFGWPVTAEAVQQQLTRYGGQASDMDMIESVEQLEVAERFASESKPDSEAPTSKPESASGSTPAPAAPAAPVASASEPLTTPAAASSTASVAQAATSEAASTPAAAASDKSVPAAPEPATVAAPAESKSTMLPIRKQKITVTKEGKKRVAPMLVTEEPTVGRVATAPAAPAPQLAPDFSRPTQALPRGGVSALVIGTKRKPEEEGAAPPTKRPKEDPSFIRPAVISPAATVSNVRLATPKVYTHLNFGGQSVFEARNGDVHDPARLTVTHNGRVIFVNYIPGHAHLLTGSADSFWAAATDDGIVHVLSPVGTRILPPLALGSALTILEANKSFLVAITSIGMVHLWDIATLKAKFAPVSLAPVLDTASRYAENGLLKAPSVTQCLVTEEGHIVIALSSGACYTYSADMMTWCRISEPFWAYGSQYWDSTGFATLFDSAATGPVAMAERRTNDEALVRAGARGKQLQRMAKNRMLQDGYQGFEDVVSIAHLESRIVSAAMMDSTAELARFVDMYVRRLAEDGVRDKLNFLFKFLNGEGTWGGASKKELLSSVLKTAAAHRSVQNLVLEYAEYV